MELHYLEKASPERFRLVRMCRHLRDGESIEIIGERGTFDEARTLAMVHGSDHVDLSVCAFGIFTSERPAWLQRPAWSGSRWEAYKTIEPAARDA